MPRHMSTLGLPGNGSRQPVFYRTKRRDYVLPFLAAILILVGCFLLAGYSDLSDPENVSKFQISFAFIAFGYVLSWYFAKQLIWLMLLVAAIARIAMLPVDTGESLDRRLWDSKILNAEHNPYLLAPDAEPLEVFRDSSWESLQNKDQTSRYLPGMLWVYSAVREFGDPHTWIRSFLIVVDLLLCLFFALRYGADRAALYAWNPLVIYGVGGLGIDYSLFLLPFVSGYLIWDFWIDQKGGVSVIKASGGIGSALGQMVCVAALLMGLGAALNIVLVPGLIWLIWHVLKRSGIQAGVVALVFGAAPLVLSMMWASISLDVDLWKVMAPEFSYSERAISLFPSIVGFIFGGPISPMVFLVLTGLITIWMVHVCESLERFISLYLIWFLILATAVYPWTFLLLAVVGVGQGNYVFRVASLSAFAYFGAYRVLGDTGTWTMPWSLQVFVWVPFLIAAAYYSVGNRSRQGFYVHSF